ncbi:HTTM domain-containing protein [Halobacterium zhouii]|uniref:HTTM domain-containing protein n=1 Tax=Halobacterium zhouii TaxID=2902624 RepID=UPI001E42CB52|nr:HTTM domain-containing protein [Halobacterium zhouii]
MTRLRRGLPAVRAALARRVSVDARALAAFRVGVGALLLADLALRARNLTAFYTDAGVLPRPLLAEQYPAFAAFSLHALSGAAWFQVVLFAVAGVAALCLLVGYRTRLATVVSLVLLASLHARNPLVLNAGDSLLRRLLLWGAFLPLGARWSVDAAGASRRSSVRDHVASVASAALLVQVVLVYVVNAVLKLRGDAWLSGDAVRVVFALDQFTVFLGDALAQYPALLEMASHVWLTMLVASPLLIVLAGRRRAVFAGLFASVHLGMLLTMQLGLFPLISVVALVPFLPPVVWNELAACVPERPQNALSRTRNRLAGALPFAPRRPTASARIDTSGGLRAAVGRWRARVTPAVAAVFLAFVLVWTAMSVGLVATPDSVASTVDPEERRWDMFAPEPLNVDGWYVVPGELASSEGARSERVDAFHGGAVRWTKPPDVAATYPTARWRKYLVDLWRSDDVALQHAFADYLCTEWSANHESTLVRVAPHYVTERVRLGAPDPTERIRLVEHACAPADSQES